MYRADKKTVVVIFGDWLQGLEIVLWVETDFWS